MKKLIVANWKMNPESLAEAGEILDFVNDRLGSIPDSSEMGLVFCPPFVFLEEVSRILTTSHLEDRAALGAQDIAIEDKTALTGEVSGPMLKKLGVKYVIIGHSERRWKLGESDKVANQKLKVALRNELIPVVCIGERSREGDVKGFLEDQIKNTFEGLSADELEKCIVAYEPVWAISTNPGAHPDNPTSALESINIIKETLKSLFNIQNSLLLYGGSVNSKNAGDFLKEEEINGVLVGGASVNKEEFVKVLEIASKI
jgi:triosephosphate isomerase